MENRFTVNSSFFTALKKQLQKTAEPADQASVDILDTLIRQDTGPTQPADTAIESRTASSVVATTKLRGNNAINTQTRYQRNNFQVMLKQLLDIPIEEYIQLDPAIMNKLDESYKLSLAKFSDDPETIAIIKIKHLLNRAIHDWQINHDREKTSKLLLSLHSYAGNKICLYSYLESWVLMKSLKDMLHGKPIPEQSQNHLLTVLNERIREGDIAGIDPDYLAMIDLISLQSLYYLDGLPVLNGGANFERGFKMMFANSAIMERCYLFLSPISFSSLDYMRLAPIDLIEQLDEQKKQLPASVPGNVMQMYVMFFLQGNSNKYNQWLEQEHNFDHDNYSKVKQIIFQFYQFLHDAEENLLIPQTKTSLKKFLFFKLDNFEKCCQAGNDQLLPLIIFIRAEMMLFEDKSTTRLTFAKVARLYEDVAVRYPNHFTSAYTYYCQAGILRKAAEVANRYARFWEGTNDLLVEYWNDICVRELLTATSLRQSKTTKTRVYDDIDTILQQWADESPAQPQTQSKKCRQGRKARSRRKNDKKQPAQLPHGEEGATTSTAENDASRLCKPVIKALPFADNHPDGLPGQYQIKSTQGAIRPFEKLLSRHWNPIIKKTLGLIRVARTNGDRDREQQIYQKVLNNPQLRACIGIERIWEEYAWTELHQFDDCFRTQTMPVSVRASAEQWVDNARKLYILPSLAYCLGLDEIYLHIKPEAVWEGALQLVEQPEVAEPTINQEIRFRLRCLFSSMGHTYSLSAMSSPDQAAQLLQTARKWYQFKAIDPIYTHGGKGTQLSGT